VTGNLSQVVEDAQRLATAVFDVYRTTAKEYERAIGPIVSPEQQKVVLDMALACVGIANKEQRVEKWREERKNGHNGHKADAKPAASDVQVMPGAEKTEEKSAVAQAERPNPAPNGPRPPEDEPERPIKPRDTRNRPVEQLIRELDIKSPAQAGFLRARKEISYIEWQRVRDEVSRREIRGAGGFSTP
jgi:hypothetical protein